MEQRLLEATEELKAVRQEMQGLQNHSLKDALQKSYTAISSINRNAEWALNTLARLEQTTERRPSVLEAMREQVAKTEPAKKQPAPSHDKESR